MASSNSNKIFVEKQEKELENNNEKLIKESIQNKKLISKKDEKEKEYDDEDEYKYEDEDEDEDDNDLLLSQALPVADLKSDSDLSIPPSTGEEYLYRVRFDLFINLNYKKKKFNKIRID